MNLLEAFVAYQSLRDVIDAAETKGSTAYKIYKFLRTVDSEREILKKAMDKQWSTEFDVPFEEADEETQGKMNEQWVSEASKVTLNIEPFLSEDDVEQLNISLNEIIKLNSIIVE